VAIRIMAVTVTMVDMVITAVMVTVMAITAIGVTVTGMHRRIILLLGMCIRPIRHIPRTTTRITIRRTAFISVGGTSALGSGFSLARVGDLRLMSCAGSGLRRAQPNKTRAQLSSPANLLLPSKLQEKLAPNRPTGRDSVAVPAVIFCACLLRRSTAARRQAAKDTGGLKPSPRLREAHLSSRRQTALASPAFVASKNCANHAA
jgi:hypothetical protein